MLTSQKVAGSVPNDVMGFLVDLIFPALGSTEPLTEMSTRNLSGGKGQPAGA
jgi:hypothetical protein